MSTVNSCDGQKVYESPDKRFTKTILCKGYGYSSPQDGSVCKVKVIIDNAKILSEVNDDQIKELIVGDVDDPVDRIFEDCIRTMKDEEICILKFHDPSSITPVSVKHYPKIPGYCMESDLSNSSIKNDLINADDCATGEKGAIEELERQVLVDDMEKSEETDCQPEEKPDGTGDDIEHKTTEPSVEKAEEQPADADQDVSSQCDEDTTVSTPTLYEVQLQLLSYTGEPEIWEMSITEKWRRSNYHKQKGLELYTRGCYEWAFRRFGLALKYIISLEHDVPSGQEEGMNINGLKHSCYLNVAACQMRHHNYDSVAKNCTKALKLQPNNSKALYRRGAAYIQLQDYEKAKEDLRRALELEPKNQAIVKQQQLLKARVQKLNQYYANAMKKMFT